MKKKAIIFLIGVMLLITLFPLSTFAAVSGNQGQKVAVTFTFPKSQGPTGEFEFSNSKLFSSYSITHNASSGDVNTKYNTISLYNIEVKDIKVTINATIASDAKVGDKCVITFTGTSASNNGDTVVNVTKSETVTVTKAPDTSKPSGTSEPSDTSKPAVSQKPSPKIDYSELNRQITIANDLKKDGYTDDSWNAMRSALIEARGLRTSSSQSAVDKGAKKLADAIAALTKVDYTKLQAAIDDGKKYSDSTGLTDLWNKYFAAFDKANQMISSGSQEDIDKATEELNAVLAELKAKMDEYGMKEVIKEVEVEVEPSNPFCNIRVHKIWLILLIISAILNVAFIVLLVLWYLNRKKKYADDTPLVRYDIADDD